MSGVIEALINQLDRYWILGKNTKETQVWLK
jgi:hypothetical protein